MIHIMLEGGPADGFMTSLHRHDAPQELRVGKWIPEAWTSTGEAWIYRLKGEPEALEGDLMPAIGRFHKAANYIFTGKKESSKNLISLWI